MFTRKTSIAVGVLCVLLGLPALASNRLVMVEEPFWSATQDAVEAIEAYGGKARIVVLPHFIIADIPDHVEADLLMTGSITEIRSGELDPGEFDRYGSKAHHIITAWNNVYMGKSREMGLDAPPSPDRMPLVNDIVPVEDYGLLSKPPGAKVYDTSEFMLGSVALGVVLPESDGSIDPSSENWTSTEENNVTSEIIAGLDWYVTKAEWRDLTWYTMFHYAVPTGYEPIIHSSSEENLWKNQVLTYLGYTGDTNFANGMRNALGTEWGVLALVVDSSNDGDNQFSDGRFGYASLGGPRLVMTYGNDGWGIGNMDAVIAHELGHCFFALDEYYSGGEGCTARSGYLNVENQNSTYPSGAGGCTTNIIFCIMRSVALSNARVCNYTKGQIGWWDDDSDSIPNIMDIPPETALYPYAPDPCSTATPAYAGSSWVEYLPNLNPRKSNPHDITLNRIAGVEYRVDGGPWHDATPNDGGWDGGKEGYHFTTDALSETTHVIETRAFHTYGLYDLTHASDTVTVTGGSGIWDQPVLSRMFVETAPNPFGPRVTVRYGVPGEYGSAVPVTMKIYDVRGREVAALIDGVRSPGPGELSWDGAYPNGSLAPSGIYFIDLMVGDSRVVRKLVMTR
jgi:hypothetical protein